jgi:serine/threonine protein kinase
MERRVLLERLPFHKNIIQMYHAFQDYNSLYYLMELHRTDLWSQLRVSMAASNDKNTREEHRSTITKFMVGCHRFLARTYMMQLVDALEHLHRHGIVHRDLKPENVLLNARGHVVVIDFGTAKDLVQTDLNGPEFVGTPEFMSPEAVAGSSGPDEMKKNEEQGALGAVHTADLWALGAILFILQVGHTPFWTTSPYLAFLRIKRCLLTRPVGIVDDETWDLISQLLQYKPEKRLGANVFQVKVSKGLALRSIEQRESGGYDCIRRHAYFSTIYKDESVQRLTPIPSLQDLCYRAVADLAHRDSLDVELCDKHPPGDKSSHDMLRLAPRDRSAVMHILDRMQLLRDPRLYARFFVDPLACRLDRIRPNTRDFVGLTQMNDDQGKAPKAKLNDPYATPATVEDITFVHISNPLFVKSLNNSCDETTRKQWMKQLKKCIAMINRKRPKLVVACGYMDDACRALLARVSESIPCVVHGGSAFFNVWMMGVECMFVQSRCTSEKGDQVAWIRERCEQVRMSKHPLFVFADCDPRDLPLVFQKRLARGRALSFYGMTDKEAYAGTISYAAMEPIDDGSVRSTDSEEDEKDEFTTKIQALHSNGLRWITIDEEEPGKWMETFTEIEE